MKLNFIISIILLVSAVIVNGANDEQHFDRLAYYNVLASESLDSVNAELGVISKSSFSNKDAFEGTLLMRKAGLVLNPVNKLSLFKSGRRKLESAINLENKNAELRFLRLMIQENLPVILGYRKHIEEDNKLIHSAYQSLPTLVQKVIAEYSKKSKVLKPGLS